MAKNWDVMNFVNEMNISKAACAAEIAEKAAKKKVKSETKLQENKNESIFILAALEDQLATEGQDYKNGMTKAVDVIKSSDMKLDDATKDFLDQFKASVQKSYGKKEK